MSMVPELQFLGCGDAFGSGGRFQACLLLRTSHSNVLIDCGASSLIAMRRYGVDPLTIDAVVLSHLHGDHFAGVPFFILDGQFGRRERPLVIAGPPGLADRMTSAMELLFPGSASVDRRFTTEFVQLPPRQPMPIGPITVTPYEVDHASGSPAFALRIECDGGVIAYSGDTAWTDSLVDAARGADVFVCEAYFDDKKVPYHLDYATLLANQSRLDCRRIILTHMSEDMLRRPDCAFERAEDGLVVSVGPA
jgi:ribonuclease BN (tRNA processing enzyme)